MTTTVTIERMCLQEEEQWYGTEPRQERLRWLNDQMDNRNYGNLDRAFSYLGSEYVERRDRPQLWCEAIKFHELRLSGLDLHGALDRMVGPVHA